MLPTAIEGEAGLTAIEVRIGDPPLLATVREAMPAAPSSEAPMAVEPAATAVANPEELPEELIVAIEGFELVQVAVVVTSWVLPLA